MSIKKKKQKKINQIEVKAPVVVSKSCNAVRVCEPEHVFDIVEQCKKCGRCV